MNKRRMLLPTFAVAVLLIAFAEGAWAQAPAAAAQCWSCMCSTANKKTPELCANTPLTLADCVACPPGSQGPSIDTAPVPCTQIPPCAGHIRAATPGPTPAAMLSPLARATLVTLMLVVGVHGLHRGGTK